jgi:hypothetical protein
MSEAQIAFLSRQEESPLEVRINFGIFAGRQATPAEIESLAHDLLPLIDELTIVAEERHEVSPHSEASVSSVRVELGSPRLPLADDVAEKVLARCEQWAHSCVAERHAEVSEL